MQETKLIYGLTQETVANLNKAGFVIVPINPAKEMIESGNHKIDECIDFWNYDSGSGYSVGQSAAYDCWIEMIETFTGLKVQR